MRSGYPALIVPNCFRITRRRPFPSEISLCHPAAAGLQEWGLARVRDIPTLLSCDRPSACSSECRTPLPWHTVTTSPASSRQSPKPPTASVISFACRAQARSSRGFVGTRQCGAGVPRRPPGAVWRERFDWDGAEPRFLRDQNRARSSRALPNRAIGWSAFGIRTGATSGSSTCSSTSSYLMRVADGRLQTLAPVWLNAQQQWRPIGRSRVMTTAAREPQSGSATGNDQK